MKRISVFLWTIALVLSLLILEGCVVATKETAIAPEIRSLFEGKYHIYPYMEKHIPRTVAVLPFLDLSGSQQGAQAVRRGFYNHFSSLPFKDMEIQRIDDLLGKAGLNDPVEINKKSPQDLGKILGVDAVVYGEISNFDKLFAVMYSQVAVGAKIRMHDTKSGEVLWTGEHTVRIHEGGISLSPIGIVATIVATAMNVRDIQLLRACDDLFRDMVKTIPAPPLAEALRPPVITLLVQDTKNLPKKAGDEIRVVIQGTPKMRAYFDIGDYRKGIDMQEQADSPGVYLGVYRVVPGDDCRKAIITGYLKDDAGAVTQWVDAIGSVTLKTTPPPKPSFLKTVGRDGVVLLSWGDVKDPDLAGYRLYRSLTPLSGFTEVAKVEVTQYRDAGLTNGVRYYYALSAVDLAGNESERAVAEGVPVAPGPTPVKGVIDKNTTWYAGASPYIIEETVVVKDKATLFVEAGTEIRSRGGALVVEGNLTARGDEGHLISWAPAEGVKTWEGIVFRNVKEKENVLTYNKITGAVAGVTCIASSPAVTASEFTGNVTGISVSGAFSKPVIERCAFRDNQGAGVAVTEGAQPTVRENTIQGNGKGGVYVQGAAPVIARNVVTQNEGGGIVVLKSAAVINENNIHHNRPFNIVGAMDGAAVNARENWWGTAKGLEVLASVKGRVDVSVILDGPYPGGKKVSLPILPSELRGTIKKDALLTLSQSPYRVEGEVSLEDGALLHIEPGVVIQYDQGAVIVVNDGGIVARGTRENPIVFTASAASPSAGFYASAVRFARPTKVNSAFSHCVVKYASIAFDIHRGNPEITKCHIAHNSQAGIYVRNDGAPVITYNTLTANGGEGALKCVGNSRPLINFNNIEGNDFAIQALSTIYLDARHNWWGKSPPDLGMILGDLERNVNIKPWLDAPEAQAFAVKP